MLPDPSKAGWLSGYFRPRLELLEDRVYPGDTILGILAVALWGSSLASHDGTAASYQAESGREGHHGFLSILDGADSFTAIAVLPDSEGAGDRGGTASNSSTAGPAFGTTNPAGTPLFADDNLARQVVLHRMGVSQLPGSPAPSADLVGAAAGTGAPWMSVSESLFASAFAGNGEGAGGRSPELLTSTSVGSAPLAFDTPTGQLVIRPDAGDHTVREGVAADGFVEVTLDGQHHSSNPGSLSFDSALAGATGTTVAGIRFDGGGQSTLILGSQHLAGSFAVQAAGATVVTEAIDTAGPLTIQAPNITVRGALRGSSIDLTASGWMTVDAAGRLDAVRSQGRAGSVSDPSAITVSAGVFVNSGQLHADGSTGGQIAVEAGKVLNAGPITADATAPDGKGGQVHIGFTDAYVATTAAVMSASSSTGPGGHVIIDGGGSGHLFSSGRHLATGSVGGAVDLFGRDVVLSGATIDASGETGGGLVRLGGDFHGSNPAIANAQTVTVTPATTLRANALSSGNGGQVFIGADQTMAFDGAVSARGGPAGGSGGFIEVSGHAGLSLGGSADAGARLGKSGTLLLDPKNITISDAPAGVFPQFDLIDPHPTTGGNFGTGTWVLSNGNFVVTNPNDNFGAGAVYLFDGLSGALLSSLVGSNPGEQVGSDGVTPLSNGNYVVQSAYWKGIRGVVTWANGSLGISGIVSDANSLVGSYPGDYVGVDFDGTRLVTPLSNGNYVVGSPHWNANRGAATWGNGSTGVSGTISDANSLVGSKPGNDLYSGDRVGSYVTPLSNGNYVVRSYNWNGYRGAVTWAKGTTGVSGNVSAANSLVGTNPGDGGGSVTPLSNGNYVVESPYWNGQRGAVTWGNGSTGISGTISEADSLIGSNPDDYVGGGSITPLSNGNYVVTSSSWNGTRGAVTWGNGSTGTSGAVSDANSLVGSDPGDRVGGYFLLNLSNGVTALSNGNYVVWTPDWNGTRGAVTWGNGSTGTSGTVSGANSLVGSTPGDLVGGYRAFMPRWGYIYWYNVTPLSNGNYVVGSPFWNGKRGAVTWGNGSTGVSGTVSEANSLIGSNPGSDMFGMNPGDLVGYYYMTPLSNGNYVVGSPFWNGKRGAVTWENGSTGISGTISDANSLVGSNPGDLVGYHGVTPLSNGNYVVDSPFWNGERGAATWGSGRIGGTISEANSLIGTNPGDRVGFGLYQPGVTPLNNGNYVVTSFSWNGARGAATWGNGSKGISGTISEANSLIGTNPGDYVSGAYDYVQGRYKGVIPLNNDNYVVRSGHWHGDRGAVTWVSGMTGKTLDGQGIITAQNSLAGRAVNAGLGAVVLDPIQQSFLAAFVNKGSGRVTVGLPDPNQFSYARGQAQTVTLTPDFLTRTLNTGIAVVLQASNDITVNSAITVSAGGNGGALTLQAGRSIVLNAPITTDNGALNLIANDPLANGVVDSQRDPVNAVITMAPGTALDSGSGSLTVELRDGAGLTNRDSGAITLQTVTAGSVSVLNNGPSPGSDVKLGPVTSRSSQYYTNPNGTTRVTGNLTARDSSITFTDSLVVNDGITVSAGANAVYFAGSGTQTLQTGRDTRFVNVNHTATGTLRLTGGLTVTGSFVNGAGTFDANDQPVSVTGAAVVLGGTYLAGTAPQTFSSGVTITNGVFTSSSGPMTVTGGITVAGGLLSGVGTVDSVTAGGGTVAPGSAGPGILTVRGAISLGPFTTFSILLNGTNAGTGYGQLAAGGPIDLGGSTLTLTVGFEPPVGSSFEILTNTGSAPIAGTFNGLFEGTVFTQSGYQFQITYHGGTGGHSVVLTRLA